MNQKELLILSITIFFTILAWVIFDIIAVKKNITVESSIRNIEPINFTLNDSVLNKLSEKAD